MVVPERTTQESYYNQRWEKAQDKPLNKYQLARLIAILEEIKKLPLPQRPTILDLGSGTGWLASVLSLLGSTRAVELSPIAVAYARERYPLVEFEAGSLFELIEREPVYDLVVSQEVIEHVEDQAAYIDLVAGCLKSQGCFIFTTPNLFIQRQRKQSEHLEWGLQPIENWIGRKEIRLLLKDKFDVLQIRAIIPGFGSRGIFKIIHSDRVRRMLRKLKMEKCYLALLLRLNLGLHLVVVARKC